MAGSDCLVERREDGTLRRVNFFCLMTNVIVYYDCELPLRAVQISQDVPSSPAKKLLVDLGKLSGEAYLSIDQYLADICQRGPDPMWRFEEGEGILDFGEVLHPATSLTGPGRREAEEQEMGEPEPRRNCRRNWGACPRNWVYVHAFLDAGLYELQSGVREERCAGIADERHVCTGLQPAEQGGKLGGPAVLVKAGHRRGNREMRQEFPGAPRVFGGDEPRLFQYAQASQRHVFEVADRGGDEKQGTGHLSGPARDEVTG